MSRIAIIGSGIVGLATGNGLAHLGHSIVYIDTDSHVLKRLKKESYEVAKLSDLENVNHEISILCIPTPSRNNRIDLRYIEKAMPYLGEKIVKEEYHLLVIRSTIPPNTTEKLLIPKLEKISQKKAGSDFGVCFNPEFLRQVSSQEDFLHPWSIVIGSIDKRSEDALFEIYKPLIQANQTPVIKTDLKTAEMIKYVQNLYNATKISFTNEIWKVCQKLEISSDTVMQSVALSAEGMWNPQYGIKGGYSYGGNCLPKDTICFLSYAKRDLGLDMPLLESTIKVNDSLKKR